MTSAGPSRTDSGQMLVPAVAILLVTITLAMVIVSYGMVLVHRGELQQAADAAAHALQQSGDAPHARAVALARHNGAARVRISGGPQRGELRVDVWGSSPGIAGVGVGHQLHAWHTVQIASSADAPIAHGGGYAGALEQVDAARVCPAVADDLRAMQRAAAAEGVGFPAVSGYRSIAEQATLYARLGPVIAAPPGRSLHHQATELDLSVGSAGSPAHAWLSRNAARFNFLQRYAWEPWHWGNIAGCRSGSDRGGAARR